MTGFNDGPCADSLANDDDALLRLAIDRMRLLSLPSQSFFRVYCLILIGHLTPNNGTPQPLSPSGDRIDVGSNGGGCRGRDVASYSLINGANSESGSYLASSICAERSALTRLRFYSDYVILKLIITTDSEQPIAPGYLCREYISSYAEEDSLIVCSNNNMTRVMKHLIRDIYPIPYFYNKCHKASVKVRGEALSIAIPSLFDALNIYNGGCSSGSHSSICQDELMRTYSLAKFSSSLDQSSIHPLRLGAAVLFEDGSVETASQMKALEYGCSLDPVVQLVVLTEKRRLQQCLSCDNNSSLATITPKLVICVDQYGIFHTLGGQSRALLSEAQFPTHQLRTCVSTIDGDSSIVSTRIVDVMEEYKLNSKLDDLSEFLCNH